MLALLIHLGPDFMLPVEHHDSETVKDCNLHSLDRQILLIYDGFSHFAIEAWSPQNLQGVNICAASGAGRSEIDSLAAR